jgi:cytochrome c peroxidase
LTPDAEAGQKIFEARNCQSCHSGPFFTDALRHDVGTIQASSGLGNGHPLEGIGIETPTLVGIWDTEPYLHNGQAPTLHDVLTNTAHTDTEGLTPEGLTPEGLTPIEAKQLVTYLLQIDFPETSAPPRSIIDQDRSQ